MNPQAHKSSDVWSDPGPGIYTPAAVDRWDASRREACSEYSKTHIDPLPAWEMAAVRIARRLWAPLVICAAVCTAIMFSRIVEAFATGRVQHILDAIQKAGQ